MTPIPQEIRLTSRARLRVKPIWYNGLRCGRSFYDPYDATVEYHVIPHDSYWSYISCGAVRLDLDESGSPVFVDIDLKHHDLIIDTELSAPEAQILCRHRFLDFPIKTIKARVVTNKYKSLFHMQFSRSKTDAIWTFSPGSMWEIDAHQCVVGLWLTDVSPDPSGCDRHLWRASVWNAYRKGRLSDIASPSSHLERGWLSVPKIFS